MKSTHIFCCLFVFFTTFLSAQTDSTIAVTRLLERGSWNFTPEHSIDLDNDGFDDLIGSVQNARLGVAYGRTAENNWSLPTYLTGYLIYTYVIIDLDENGWLDFVFLGEDEQWEGVELYALYNPGAEDEWSVELMTTIDPDETTYPGYSAAELIEADNFSGVVFSYATQNFTPEREEHVAVYDLLADSLMILHSTTGESVVKKLTYAAETELGPGLVFGVGPRVNQFEPQHPAQDIYWLGLTELNEFLVAERIAENINYQFHVRDADGDGNTNLILGDTSLATMWWQPIDRPENNPAKTYLFRGAEGIKTAFPHDANGDGLIDVTFNDTTVRLNGNFSYVTLKVSGSVNADTVTTDTAVNFSVQKNIRPYRKLLRDLDGDGFEEYPAYARNFFADGLDNTTFYYRQFDAGLNQSVVCPRPILDLANLASAYSPGSGIKQEFLVAGQQGDGSSIYRIYEMGNSGRYYADRIFRYLPDMDFNSGRYDVITRLKEIQSNDGYSNSILFELHNSSVTNSTPGSLPDDVYKIDFSEDGAAGELMASNIPISDFTYADFFGSGEQVMVVMGRSLAVLRDQDQDMEPEQLLLNFHVLWPEVEQIDDFGDVNNDGLFDILSDTTVYFQRSDTTFEPVPLPAFRGTHEKKSHLYDINDDGWLDVLYGWPLLAVGINNGNETFNLHYAGLSDNLRSYTKDMLTDANADGKIDLVRYSGFDIEILDFLTDTCSTDTTILCPPGITIPYDSVVTKFPETYTDRGYFFQTDITGNNDTVTLVYNGNLFYLGKFMETQPRPERSENPPGNFIEVETAFVYPNPTTDLLKIHCPDCTETSATLRIFNRGGELMRSFTPRLPEDGWPVADLSAGFYFYVLLQDEQIVAAGNFYR